jgi:hypothetical protein
MKSRLVLLPILGLVVAVACQAPAIPPSAPSISFISFRNTTSNVIIPASNNVVPANFVAEVASSDRNRVTDVQCFNGGTAVTSGAAYRTVCSYSGVTGAPEIRAVATNNNGLTAQATKLVTVDNTPPVANALRIGGTSFDLSTGSSFSTTITLGATTLLRVSSADADVLSTFIERDGRSLISSATNSSQFELVPQDTSPFNLSFGVIDKAGNVTRYSVLVSVNAVVGDGVPPTVNIGSPASGATVSGNLLVSVNASDTSGIQQVTLIANNNPVQVTQPSLGIPSISFPLDTLQFENGTLELKAIAVDKSGLSTTSNTVSVTINNIQAPVISIASPSNNADVNTSTIVSVSIRRRTSAFDYPDAAQCVAAGLAANCGTIKVDLIDYRGTIVETKFVNTVNPGATRLFETAVYDLSAIPNDTYTIRAAVSVLVSGDPVITTLSEQIAIKNKNANLSPPAAIVVIPQRMNELQTTLPIYRQPVGYLAADISDNNGIVFAELRMTCDSCAAGTGPVNALEEYSAFEPPITNSTRIVMRFNANGTPFLPDGDYTMRLVVQDVGGNRNIQEIKARIDRDPSTTNPFSTTVVAGENNVGDKLSPGSSTFATQGFNPGTNYSVVDIIGNPSGRVVAVYTSFGTPGTVVASRPPPALPLTFVNSFGVGYLFTSSGVWNYIGQFQNMTTGDIYTGSGAQTVLKLP